MSHLQFCCARILARQNCTRKLQVWHQSKTTHISPCMWFWTYPTGIPPAAEDAPVCMTIAAATDRQKLLFVFRAPYKCTYVCVVDLAVEEMLQRKLRELLLDLTLHPMLELVQLQQSKYCWQRHDGNPTCKCVKCLLDWANCMFL